MHKLLDQSADGKQPGSSTRAKASYCKIVNQNGKLHKNYTTASFKTGMTTFTGAIALLEKTSKDKDL